MTHLRLAAESSVETRLAGYIHRLDALRTEMRELDDAIRRDGRVYADAMAPLPARSRTPAKPPTYFSPSSDG